MYIISRTSYIAGASIIPYVLTMKITFIILFYNNSFVMGSQKPEFDKQKSNQKVSHLSILIL